jgi:hypothetical protein
MMQNVVGVVIEPPVGVANSVLESARRLAAELAEKGIEPTWLPPESWVVPLIRLARSEDKSEVAEFAVRAATQRIEEFGGQLSRFCTVDGPAGSVVLASRMSSKEGEIALAIEAMVPRLDSAGLEPDAVADPILPVATVPESARAALDEILASRPDVPLASWLVGGIAVAQGPEPAPGALWCSARVRYLPLRRLGARRDG